MYLLTKCTSVVLVVTEAGVLTKTVYADNACSAQPVSEQVAVDQCVDVNYGSLESYIYTCSTKSIYSITSAREYSIRT